MSRVRFANRHVSVSAEVPDSVARLLRKAKSTAVPGPERQNAQAADRLTIAPTVPALNVQRRDRGAAIEFLPAAQDAGNARASAAPADDLAAQAAAIWWYHTIELPGVVTQGIYDHRPLVGRYGLPASLAGERALDVATFDGFWAFELERRGAAVTAIDLSRTSQLDLPTGVAGEIVSQGLDRPTGDGFRLAHRALGSGVERVECSVYDLAGAGLGTFDFVHLGDLLLHLERPLAALRAVRQVTKGQLLLSDVFDPTLEPGLIRYLGGWSGAVWWSPSLDALAQMVIDAGFSDVEVKLVYSLGTTERQAGPWRACLLATP